MSRLAPLVIALPLIGAGICVLFRGRFAVCRSVGIGLFAVQLGLAVALVLATASGDVVVAQVGGWPAPFAIPLGIDPFSALMLTVAALMVLVCGSFAVTRDEDRAPLFYPLALVLLAGVSGAFATADLFNLFVFFEVMLLASYVLLTIERSRSQVRAGAVYVVTNLTASTLFLLGVAIIYGLTGTVNMGALRTAAEGVPGVAFGGALLLVSFGVKASLVPVHGWLPRAYPRATPAIAAMFSGLLTKVGVYALFRVYAVVFGGAAEYRPLILGIASVTMLVGVLGAVGRENMREILSFHIVSQVGYMIMGLGLFGPLGLAGGIFYILHHIVVKTSLFLAAGSVESYEGTGNLDRLGAVARAHPLLAAGFVVSALSLAGLPPFSGFFAKLVLVRAAFETQEYAVAAVSIAVSLLTLFSMLKIWNGVFWGERRIPAMEEAEPAAVAVAGGADGRRSLVVPGVVLAGVSVLMGLFAETVFVLSRTAAEMLVDLQPYIDAVAGGAR